MPLQSAIGGGEEGKSANQSPVKKSANQSPVKKSASAGDDEEGEHNAVNDSVNVFPDPYYPPIIYLPEVEVNAGVIDVSDIRNVFC